MHKSAIIFLLGLLVVLMPVGASMNIISNANAITESEYYADQYMRYVDELVNYYEDESSYTSDGYGGGSESQDRTYGNNDYKSKDKDKDRYSNNLSISKINCNTLNYNVIGNVTGDNNIGNDGREVGGAANSNGALSANAYGSNGDRYNDGYEKGKDVTCIISNNNTIITSGGGGNVTTPPGPEPVEPTCEECFIEALEAAGIDIADFNQRLSAASPQPTLNGIPVNSINQICEVLDGATTPLDRADVQQVIGAGIEVGTPDRAATIQAILNCLEQIGLIE
jgi:hypothetical protein